MLNAYLFIKAIGWLVRTILKLVYSPVEFIYCVAGVFPHSTAEELAKTIGICFRFMLTIIIICAICIG